MSDVPPPYSAQPQGGQQPGYPPQQPGYPPQQPGYPPQQPGYPPQQPGYPPQQPGYPPQQPGYPPQQPGYPPQQPGYPPQQPGYPPQQPGYPPQQPGYPPQQPGYPPQQPGYPATATGREVQSGTQNNPPPAKEHAFVGMGIDTKPLPPSPYPPYNPNGQTGAAPPAGGYPQGFPAASVPPPSYGAVEKGAPPPGAAPQPQPYMMQVQVEIWKCTPDGQPWKSGAFLKRCGTVPTWSSETFEAFIHRCTSHQTATSGMRIEGPVISFMTAPSGGQEITSPSWNQPIGPWLNPQKPFLIVKFNAGKPAGLLKQLGSFF